MYLKLAFQNLINSRGRSVLTIISISIAIAALTFLLGLNQGIKNFIFQNFTAQNPLNEIIAKPKQNTLSVLTQRNPQENLISTETVEKLKTIPHVTAVYPESSLRNIASVQINVLGQGLQSDAMIFGIPYELIQNDGINKKDWEQTNEPYPAVISSKLLDLYNFTVAPNNNLPALNPKNFLGTEINILLNNSTFFNKQSTVPPLKAKIIGFSNEVNLLGISIPQNIISDLNKKYNSTEIPDSFFQANIYIDQLENLDSVRTEIKKLNLQATSSAEAFQKIENYFKVFTLGLSIISLVILLISGLMIANTFLANIIERYKDIGILKSIGVSTKDIQIIFLTEAGLVGIFSGICGIILAIISSFISDNFLLPLFENLSLKPTSFFDYNIPMIFSILSFSIIFSMIFAFLPATKAAKLEPLQALNN